MNAGFVIFLFVALFVLSLLSFLRNGAILRGGVVAVQQGTRKGNENASVITLHGTKPSSLSLPLEPPAVSEGSELQQTRGESSGVLLGEAQSPHSQSSQVFLQARRNGQAEKRRAALLRQQGVLGGGGGGDGGVASLGSEGGKGTPSAAGRSDVAAAWDPTQLRADDHIRLVFLFTFSLPVFAFWSWELRQVRVPYVVCVYCYVTGLEKAAVPLWLQTALAAAPVFMYLASCFAALLYYAFFVYLNHRDKDVSLKRHSNTWGNKIVNWLKFRVYRRYVNFQCCLWKRYFSLQLVPAYGPLPLFLFPEGEGEGASLSHDASSTKAEGGQGCENDESNEHGTPAGTPSRRYTAAAAASVRHNPFYVAVHSDHNSTSSGDGAADDGSPQDTPLFGRTSSVESPSFLRARSSSSRTVTTSGFGDEEDGPLGAASGPVQQESDDWDEEERGQLRRRGTGSSTRLTTVSSAARTAADAAAAAPKPAHARERSSSFSSADLTSVLRGPPAGQQPQPPTPPPPMRRAHYFFAAHPHGILPWCCCVNLISNVTGRDAKLFTDNRVPVLHPSRAVVEEEENGGEMNVRGNGWPRTGNFFTTTHTRAAAANDTDAARSPRAGTAAAVPSDPAQAAQQSGLQCASPAPDTRTTATTTHHYAKGRYYVYHASLRKFVLRVDRDEAVPSSAADAAVYQQRLQKEEEERRRHAQNSGRTSPPRMSVGRRLKIRIRAVVATFPFYVPIMRELYMFYGYMDASYETCKRVLLYNNSTRRERDGRSGAPRKPSAPPSSFDQASDSDADSDGEATLPDDLNHLMLFPGGASEALLSSSHGPARVLLRRRKGFLRLALHTQSGLVPVYTFGETDYFDQLDTATTRYAAPLEDDSTLFSTLPSAQNTAEEPTATAATAAAGVGLHRKVIPSYTYDGEKGDNEVDECTNAGGNTSPRSPPLRPSTRKSTQQQGLHHHKRELERRLLRDEAEARDREGRLPQSPAQRLPLTPAEDTSSARASSSPPTSAAAPRADSPRATQPTAAKVASASTAAVAAAAPASTTRGRLPRFVQAVQRLFQETFGISLPVVRNLIPHRVTGATVVGRPIYFELPPDVQQMYTDPANFYDREKERVVLQAAQEVYFNELQELFLKYAPRYLKDPSRRKLEIL